MDIQDRAFNYGFRTVAELYPGIGRQYRLSREELIELGMPVLQAVDSVADKLDPTLTQEDRDRMREASLRMVNEARALLAQEDR